MAKNYDKKKSDSKMPDQQNSQSSNAIFNLEEPQRADDLNKIPNKIDATLEHSTLSDPTSDLFIDSTTNIIKDASVTNTKTLLTDNVDSSSRTTFSRYSQ